MHNIKIKLELKAFNKKYEINGENTIKQKVNEI